MLINRLNYDLRHDWRGECVLTCGIMNERNLSPLAVYGDGRLDKVLEVIQDLTVIRYRFFEDAAFDGNITELRANDGITAPQFDTRTCVKVTPAQARVLLHVAPLTAAPIISKKGIWARGLFRGAEP